MLTLKCSAGYVDRLLKEFGLRRIRKTTEKKENIPTDAEVRGWQRSMHHLVIAEAGYRDDDILNGDETAWVIGLTNLYEWCHEAHPCRELLVESSLGVRDGK